MQTEKKVHYTQKKSNLTVWIAVCICILIYLVIRFINYADDGENKLYEVTASWADSYSNMQYTALALREETVVSSNSSGYVNFFAADATPVSVGSKTYVIDKNGELSSRLAETGTNQALLNENELDDIKDIIFENDIVYDRDSYYETYSFKNQVESQILDMINSNVFDAFEGSDDTDSYDIYSSDISGIILHNVDGFEQYSADSISASLFRRENYNKTIIKSNDQIKSGDPVYKIVTSEEWNLVIQLDDISKFEDCTYVTIRFLKDGITTEGSFETKTAAGVNYGIITLDKYMIRYLSDRYLQIQIDGDQVSGLKIPQTAVCEKYFYLIPVEFATSGGNSTGIGFLKKSDDISEYVDCEILKETESYYYVDTSVFDDGDILIRPETNDEYKIGAKDVLQGVYLLSGNDYVFVPIDIISESNGYYIISSDGIQIYDRILEDASEKNDQR